MRRAASRYVALLRAVNVGGTGRLPMADLRALCAEAGFTRIETYIASGNVLFDSPAPVAKLRTALEARLQAYAGKPVGVFLRDADEIQGVLDDNPFPGLDARLTYAVFLHDVPPQDLLAGSRGLADEQVRAGRREIYVHYPRGMGSSKLRLPAAAAGTARNLNTVGQLADLCGRVSPQACQPAGRRRGRS
jgi:uncharacterized protein (DUF1697 family)